MAVPPGSRVPVVWAATAGSVGRAPKGPLAPITALSRARPVVWVVPGPPVVPAVTPGRVAPAWAAPRPRVPPVTGAPGVPVGPAATPGPGSRAPTTVRVPPAVTAAPVGPVGRPATPMAAPPGSRVLVVWAATAARAGSVLTVAPGPITALSRARPVVWVVPAVRLVPVVTPGRVAPVSVVPRPR